MPYAPPRGYRGPLPIQTLPRSLGDEFLQALALVAPMEGGDVDHPRDPGGATRWGVTQATFHAWLRSRGAPDMRSIWSLSAEEAAKIYRDRYWTAGHCELLTWPAAAAHFDAMVQHGPGGRGRGGAVGAIHLLQRAVGETDDGIAGPSTRAALEWAGPGVTHCLLWERAMHYWGILVARPELAEVFGRGWRTRIRHLRDHVLPWVPVEVVVPHRLDLPRTRLPVQLVRELRPLPLPRDVRAALKLAA